MGAGISQKRAAEIEAAERKALGLSAPQAVAPPASGPRFGKQWTEAERLKQQRQLADLLRRRAN